MAIKQSTAWTMADMMSNAVENGTGTEANFYSTAVAGKTGTTEDDKDRYFVGFTMYYVAAVWTGYDNPEKMYFSGNPACQIFRNIMSDIHAGLPYRAFPEPEEYEIEDPYDDWYDWYDWEEYEEETPETTEPPSALPDDDWSEPEYTEPEYTEPEYTEPEYTEPEYTEPEYTEPEYSEPEYYEEEYADG